MISKNTNHTRAGYEQPRMEVLLIQPSQMVCQSGDIDGDAIDSVIFDNALDLSLFDNVVVL